MWISKDAASPAETVAEWRRRRLRAAGVAEQTAQVVASDRGYDVHALLELIDRGCPAELAARIVAPLEGGGSP